MNYRRKEVKDGQHTAVITCLPHKARIDIHYHYYKKTAHVEWEAIMEKDDRIIIRRINTIRIPGEGYASSALADRLSDWFERIVSPVIGEVLTRENMEWAVVKEAQDKRESAEKNLRQQIQKEMDAIANFNSKYGGTCGKLTPNVQLKESNIYQRIARRIVDIFREEATGGYAADVIESEATEFAQSVLEDTLTCPNCGDPIYIGNHNVQKDLGIYVCEPW